MSIEEIEHICLRRNIPFYCYRLPDTQEIIMGVQKTPEVKPFKGFDSESNSGFVISPFHFTEETPRLFIKEDFRVTGDSDNSLLKSWLRSVHFNPEKSEREAKMQTKEDYLEKVSDLVDFLKQRFVSKVVYSRVISVNVISTHYIALFRRLAGKYPNAFIYYFHLPGRAVWMGASPEMFLRKFPDYFQTVSLAGTKQSEDMLWSEKEYKEHEYVVRFIDETLKEHRLFNVVKNAPETLQAGNCFHLKTDFLIKENISLTQLDSLVNALHPTPAVCGYPQQLAMNEILKRESYEREYYSGFSGPFSPTGKLDLFVNLRCMKIVNGKAELFVGGGITEDSDPQQEWEETTLKSRTIGEII
jgi:isochorismate synthase